MDTLVISTGLHALIGVGTGLLLSRVRRRLLLQRATAPEPAAAPGFFGRHPLWGDVALAGATGAGFAALWVRYGPTAQTAIVSAYFAIFVLIFALDVSHRWVPNVVLLPAAMLALGASALTGHPTLSGALSGGVAGFAGFSLIALAYRGAMGAGDVKLAGVIGLMTGFPGVLTALATGILIGGGVAAALLISGQKTRKSYIPYAPFLVTGALLSLVFGA